VNARFRRLLIGCLSFLWIFHGEAGELHIAAKKGDSAGVKRSIESGAQVDAPDASGSTALYVAAQNGQAEIVVLLLAAGANPRHQTMGRYGSVGTALHAAVRAGHLDAARALLKAGVDPNLPDDGVGPPLHVAIRARQEGSIKLLKSYGARSRSAEPVDSMLASADLSLGQLASNSCAVCHAMTKDPGDSFFRGPSLWNVVDRAKAGVATFEYSGTLRGLGGNWSYADLSSYIADPRQFAPGTTMEWAGIKDATRRAALIAYLRTLSAAPRPVR
jgi:cytochrome c